MSETKFTAFYAETNWLHKSCLPQQNKEHNSVFEGDPKTTILMFLKNLNIIP